MIWGSLQLEKIRAEHGSVYGVIMQTVVSKRGGGTKVELSIEASHSGIRELFGKSGGHFNNRVGARFLDALADDEDAYE